MLDFGFRLESIGYMVFLAWIKRERVGTLLVLLAALLATGVLRGRTGPGRIPVQRA